MRCRGLPATQALIRYLVVGLGLVASAVVILSGPSPDLVALFHGSVIGLLLLLLFLTGALRGRRRAMLVSGLMVSLFYLFITSLPWVSVEVVPRLPTERLIANLGEQVVRDVDSNPGTADRRLAHWSARSLGHWGWYEEPGQMSVLWSPRRVAFQRVGHDLAAMILGLIVAVLVGFMIEEKPALYDSDMLPANQGRGSPEALRMLIARSRDVDRSG